MYNENKLFQVEEDSVIYKETNRFSGVRYNQNESLGSVLMKDRKVPYFVFPSFTSWPFIRHGFSTRVGGCSTGIYGALNLSYTRGDQPEKVTKNYRAVCQSMDMNPEHIVFTDQVHDTVVLKAGRKDCQGENLENRKLSGIDGLITDEKNVVLCTSYADCVPLFFVDPVKKAIGLSHSGWRGTVGKIGKKTVEMMVEEFGCQRENIHCVIGPSICAECYEVSQDVIEKAAENFTGNVLKDCVYAKKNGKYQLDLWLLNKYALMETGLPEKQIVISNVCTCCNHTLLFSHRASGGKRGNLCGFLELV